MTLQRDGTTDHQEGLEIFQFDEWVNKNQLQSIQELMIKNKADTINTIRHDSTHFKSVIRELETSAQKGDLSKIHIISKLWSAVSSLSSIPRKIIIDPQEQHVIDMIQKHMKTILESEQTLNALYDEETKNMEQIKFKNKTKIETAMFKVNTIFTDLQKALEDRKKLILNELQQIQKSSDDEKTHSDILNKISDLKQVLTKQEQQYNDLTSTNDNRKERKSKIIDIGENVQQRFKETESKIKARINAMNEYIIEQKTTIFDIDFEIDVQQTVDAINEFGLIVNTKHKFPFDGEDELLSDHEIDNEIHGNNEECDRMHQNGKWIVVLIAAVAKCLNSLLRFILKRSLEFGSVFVLYLIGIAYHFTHCIVVSVQILYKDMRDFNG